MNEQKLAHDQERIFSLDILRATAIICIVTAHLHFFILSEQLNIISGYIMWMGVGIFTFISGLLIDFKYRKKISSLSDILSFFRKRALRILPLSWLALLFFVVLAFVIIPFFFVNLTNLYPKSNIDFAWIVSQFIGCQMFIKNFESIFWFVGFILICYFVYPFLARYGTNFLKLIGLSLVTLCVFLLPRLMFGLIDDRVFYYFPVFVGGIIVNRVINTRTVCNTKSIGLLASSFLILFLLFMLQNQDIMPYSDSLIFQEFLFSGTIILGCTLLFATFNKLLPVKKNIFYNKFSRLVNAVSFSAYSTYLFHFQLITIGAGILQMFNLSTNIFTLILIFIIIPLTFIITYYIEKLSMLLNKDFARVLLAKARVRKNLHR
jgi:peptidoglycan/LPS O-acetylase OafA/YrhL